MATGRSGAVIRPLETLFTIGTLGNLSDGQLLEQFASRRDGGESAFEVLVARHGPMVLRICRQILADPHDAEDAFQATFLVLVRRAQAIRKRDSLACWLHGVARRVALRSRAAGSRYRYEQPSSLMTLISSDGEQPRRADIRSTVREEIALLPEKYRAPVVLCDLEGKTHAEAAATLSWPVGTVSGRLSRARDLLRARFNRQGAALGVGLTLGGLPSREAPAAVAESFVRQTTRSATAYLVGPTASGAPAVSRSVAALVAELLRDALLRNMQAAAALLVAGSALGSAAMLGWKAELTEHRQPPHAPIAARATRAPRSSTKNASTAPATSPQQGHSAPITTVAVSPGGRVLASGSRDTTVKLWDIRTGQERNTLRGHSGPVLALAFAHDGKTLASSSEDRTVKLWDVDSGRETLSVPVPPEEPVPVALDFGPQGPGRGSAGRDQCANGPAQPACPSA